MKPSLFLVRYELVNLDAMMRDLTGGEKQGGEEGICRQMSETEVI